MGNSSACLSDAWAIHHNVAGLAEIRRPSVAASYHSIPTFRHFIRMAAAFAQTLAGGTAGAGVFRFGDDLYNEHMIVIGYSNTFGLASLGIKATYHQYRATGRPTRDAITISFGGIAKLTPHILFGAHITNLNQPLLDVTTGERITTRLAAGIAFRSSENLIVAFETEKEVQHAPTMRAGIEYRASRSIALRTGFNIRPQSGFAGLGLTFGQLQVDYATQLNYPFGLSHQATTTWFFEKR